MAERTMGKAAAAAMPRLFVRESSGLVKAMGPTGTLMATLAPVSIAGVMVVFFSQFPSQYPNANLILLLTIGTIACMFLAYTYALIAQAIPRTGADYVMSSRVIHPALGFAVNFLQTIFLAFGAGAPISWLASTVGNNILLTAGTIYHIQGFINASRWLSTVPGIITVGTIAIVAICLSLLLPTRTVVRIQGTSVVLVLLASTAIAISLFTVNQSAFAHNWDRIMGSGAYAHTIPSALQHGLSSGGSIPIGQLLAGLLLVFNALFAFQVGVMFAGEVRQTNRSFMLAGIGTLVLLWVILLIETSAIYHAMPANWFKAQAYLTQNVPGGSVPTAAFINHYAVVAHPMLLLILLVGIAWFFGLLINGQGWVFVLSRSCLAWAFDRAVPDGVAYVNPSTGAPVVAVVLTAIVAEIGLILSQTTGLSVIANFTFNAAIAIAFVSLASALFPFVKRDMFERAPGLVRQRIAGIPVITITSAITCAFMVWLIVSAFAYPAVAGVINGDSLKFTIGILVLGVVIFYVARAYRLSREGIDILRTYEEIPPA